MGEIEGVSGVGAVGNAKCGDIMRIFLDIGEDGAIREAKFKTFGCGAGVATGGGHPCGPLGLCQKAENRHRGLKGVPGRISTTRPEEG